MKSGSHKLLFMAALAIPGVVPAVPVNILTPQGTITINVAHAGPTGQLVEPDPPGDAGFRPPAIFAAPLPTGSGARALGQGGAFTAVADDATAASWNPAGLVQLEYPEFSVVYRGGIRGDDYQSRNRRLEAGSDDYASRELNYLSAVYPYAVRDRNAVFSLNYQETYDFTQQFSARYAAMSQQSVSSVTDQTFTKTMVSDSLDEMQSVTLSADIRTDVHSQINQRLNSSLLSTIDFRQQGTIDAISPAFALEVNPKLSFGAALNIYTDGAVRGNPLRSALTAEYEGTSDSIADITTTRDSIIAVSWIGEWYSGPPANPVPVPMSGSDTSKVFDVDTAIQTDFYTVRGMYSENNATDDLLGANATLGALWTANEKLTLGVALDLPWTGRGLQTKWINHQVSTLNSNGVEVAESTYANVQQRNVKYTFPLYWSVGALWRGSDRFYTSLDASCTHWSKFSYKADGETRINPLNGESAALYGLDDCWSVRMGGEYLWMPSWTEIPLRAGVYWEQRPAVGAPDEYWGVSLGTGISLGKGDKKVVLDVAYVFEQGNNVMGSLLSEQAVCSDSTKHQLFISAIWHF
ncbi:MAG: outer membrane protein transport protein [Pontiellaceae bacterium]|nr:outer membrane protein transport protein [Pontiellaceae bacterium]